MDANQVETGLLAAATTALIERPAQASLDPRLDLAPLPQGSRLAPIGIDHCGNQYFCHLGLGCVTVCTKGSCKLIWTSDQTDRIVSWLDLRGINDHALSKELKNPELRQSLAKASSFGEYVKKMANLQAVKHQAEVRAARKRKRGEAESDEEDGDRDESEDELEMVEDEYAQHVEHQLTGMKQQLLEIEHHHKKLLPPGVQDSNSAKWRKLLGDATDPNAIVSAVLMLEQRLQDSCYLKQPLWGSSKLRTLWTSYMLGSEVISQAVVGTSLFVPLANQFMDAHRKFHPEPGRKKSGNSKQTTKKH
eukprot:TRINITY_DN18732_c0_g1_i1.p1 TRINITY_DN18732_c0_g1~~TRINITY_DN18732_c0_g1_i1.p1  ORF type:complete len:305 (+),score=81.27 TRINITY_DN18732_c0_g1_i1:198-1112(+)